MKPHVRANSSNTELTARFSKTPLISAKASPEGQSLQKAALYEQSGHIWTREAHPVSCRRQRRYSSLSTKTKHVSKLNATIGISL